jgi:excinuclease ABC subunit A
MTQQTLSESQPFHLQIKGASAHNLKHISIEIPHHQIVAITGISGSGKSSLAFDVIYGESRYRFLQSLSSHNRQRFHAMPRPAVEAIQGLRPAIAVDQRSNSSGPRSTVGTLTEISDHLRLLFARLGRSSNNALEIHRSLFSFNTQQGACPACTGLGLAESIDIKKLISDPGKSLREGALRITTPTGYIIYSQVTMDVLQQVCESEGFSVDTPWEELTKDQQHIVLYGSSKILIPYGKHPLESRMKWKGITAKPREEGFYKGILPVMEDILSRSRNDNILRFASTGSCPECHGSRLSPDALSVIWNGMNIAEVSQMPVSALCSMLQDYTPTPEEAGVYREVSSAILRRGTLIEKLGIDYLTVDRSSDTLSGGEAQRLRLASQAASGLQGVIFVLDEPTAGLHPADTMKLMDVLWEIRDAGDTIVVVEHDEHVIRNSDWIVDIGPAAGVNGGEVLFCGSTQSFLAADLPGSPTWQMFRQNPNPGRRKVNRDYAQEIRFENLSRNNIEGVTAILHLNCLNLVTGVSGAGKSSLTEAIEAAIAWAPDHYPFHKIIRIDQKPIGRTPRSNAATYTRVFDAIRKLYGTLPAAKAAGLTPSDFSFNTGNGRCTACEGAGVIPMGMHFLGQVLIPCEVCHGERFLPAVLDIMYHGKNILDVLLMSVSEGCNHFSDHPSISYTLQLLESLGLGYIPLGQPATTLSGGEAQRIRIASELAAPSTKACLYLLDEPTMGLHDADVRLLLGAFNDLIGKGHTILCIEHHKTMILASDHLIDMGPGSGKMGGKILYSGAPDSLSGCHESLTGRYLLEEPLRVISTTTVAPATHLSFTGIQTHNLKSADIRIPHGQITMITGVSGSGKSSLATDTIFAECSQRFNEHFSTWIRTHLNTLPRPPYATCSGITPALSVNQSLLSDNPRSTVGTWTGISDLLRLLYARSAQLKHGKGNIWASHFSFNHQDGACSDCDGLGENWHTDPERLITEPHKSILAGAMDGTKSGKFYGDPHGQWTATLQAAGDAFGIDYTLPWNELSAMEQQIAMHGTGDHLLQVIWRFKRGAREGEHRFETRWQGFAALVDEEFSRKHSDQRGDALRWLMKQIPCESCGGSRLSPEGLAHDIGGLNIHEAGSLEIPECIQWLEQQKGGGDLKHFHEGVDEILSRLSTLRELSLGYLTLNRRTETLSGGERQRLKLYMTISSGLSGITIVLDEPMAALHQMERSIIQKYLVRLRDQGNTLVVVEHQPDCLQIADHVIELGPGPGSEGGNVIFTGTPHEYLDSGSNTALALQRGNSPKGLHPQWDHYISVTGAQANNLKNIDIRFPAGALVSITGVSGAGKSTLLKEVLLPSLQVGKPIGCATMEIPPGISTRHSQSGINSRNHQGNVLTYTGMAEPIRKLMASLPEVKAAGFKAGDFSVHKPGGRCERCKGSGFIGVSMDFLPDVEMICPECEGKRFRAAMLAFRIAGMNIHEIHLLTVAELLENFSDKAGAEAAAVRLTGRALAETGLGHLAAGQTIRSLSGGEWQRLNLALTLAGRKPEPTIYLLDEPARGLSWYDAEELCRLFHRMTEAGHTIVMTTHHPILMHASHWQIALGPEGGNRGGHLLYCGPAIQIPG